MFYATQLVTKNPIMGFSFLGNEFDIGGFWDEIIAPIRLWIMDALGIDWFLGHALGSNNLESIKDILFFSSNDYNFFWKGVNTVLSATKPVGFALITTFFLIYVFDLASKDQITFDGLVKMATQLIIIVAVAGNIDVIINAFLSIGDSLLNKISSLAGMGGDGGSSWKGLVYDSNGMMNDETVSDIINAWAGIDKETGESKFILCAWFSAFFVWLIHQLAVIGTYFAAFSRALDVGWRIGLAPIGVANSFDGGSNSAGIRYLKNLLASILSGVMIYLVVALGFKLSASLLATDTIGTSNVIAAMGCQLATAGAAIGVSAKSKELIQ